MIERKDLDPPAGEKIEQWHFRLYVAGQSPKSLKAVANLMDLCEIHLAEIHQVEIIDLVKDPRLAREDDVLAIPTLVVVHPPPKRKVIGDLSNTARVLASLRIPARA